jgi:hypothetical protein
MICSMMQPTYLPWAGYLNLISQADIFVFLDDVQFQKNSWHNRNRLLVNKKPHWLTVPVRHKALEQTIKETEIDATKPWRKKHSKLLQQTYSKHPFAEEMLCICSEIEKGGVTHLAELNVNLILWLLEKLDIKTEVLVSSDLDIEGKRTTRLIEVLHKLQVDSYLSPGGAMEYLKEDDFSGHTSIELKFQEFDPLPYQQKKQDVFESHLSILDVVANIGWEGTKRYI